MDGLVGRISQLLDNHQILLPAAIGIIDVPFNSFIVGINENILNIFDWPHHLIVQLIFLLHDFYLLSHSSFIQIFYHLDSNIGSMNNCHHYSHKLKSCKKLLYFQNILSSIKATNIGRQKKYFDFFLNSRKLLERRSSVSLDYILRLNMLLLTYFFFFPIKMHHASSSLNAKNTLFHHLTSDQQ